MLLKIVAMSSYATASRHLSCSACRLSPLALLFKESVFLFPVITFYCSNLILKIGSVDSGCMSGRSSAPPPMNMRLLYSHQASIELSAICVCFSSACTITLHPRLGVEDFKGTLLIFCHRLKYYCTFVCWVLRHGNYLWAWLENVSHTVTKATGRTK